MPVEQEVVTCYRVGPLPLGPMYQPSTAPWASQSCLRLPGGEDCKSSFQNILMFLKQKRSNIISNKNYSSANFTQGATWVPRKCELQLQLKWGFLWTWSRGSWLQHLMSGGECYQSFNLFKSKCLGRFMGWTWILATMCTEWAFQRVLYQIPLKLLLKSLNKFVADVC